MSYLEHRLIYPEFWDQFNKVSLVEFGYKRLEKYDKLKIKNYVNEMISDCGLETDFLDQYDDEYNEDIEFDELEEIVSDIINSMNKRTLIEVLKDFQWLEENPKDFIIKTFDDFKDYPSPEKPIIIFTNPNQLNMFDSYLELC